MIHGADVLLALAGAQAARACAGIRRAGPADLDSISALLRPLEEAGVLVKRSREELATLMGVRGRGV